MGQAYTGDPVERFWSYVVKTEDCWEWVGPRDDGGYGTLWIGGEKHPAHRFSWELHNGPIPEGLWVLHTCDNPPCVKPAHHFLGTNSDNMLDMAKKGRSGMAKLNADCVREARQQYMAGVATVTQLANEYGVSTPAMHDAITGKTWKHVK